MRQAVRDLKTGGPESITREGTLGVDDGGSGDAAAAGDLHSVGKYRIISCLGEGGQASVYRAVHPVMEREVIIKLSRRATKETGLRQRLVEEGRMLAQLDHPGLARVHDLDFHEGRSYLVLEFVQGRSLSQYIKDSPMSPREAARIVAAIARALSEAHRRGIVHRDIKPENILIDADGRARLIDFGIASMRDAWVEGGAEFGEISGTLEFMAPEQARGDATVGPRSDLFSLGAVIYKLLTGKAPFEGTTIGECLDRAQRCDFDRSALSTRSIPRALARICLKAMQPDPEDRFTSSDQLAGALEAYVQRPMRLVGVAAAAVVIIGLALFAFWPGSTFQILEASLWRMTEGGPSPLMEGDSVRENDALILKFHADRDLYVYVLNEDDKGHRACLFPRAGMKLQNPLHGGVGHVLPGEDEEGDSTAWPVTTAGDREHIFLVASVSPLDDLETYAREETNGGGEESRLRGDALEHLLRGIEGVTKVKAEAIRDGDDPLADVIRDLKQSDLRDDLAEGLWLRKIRLRNP